MSAETREEQTPAPEPQIKKKRKRWPLLVALLVLVFVGIGVAAWYAIGTPHYSLFQLQRAFEQNNVEVAETYVDIDALSDQVVDAVVAELEDEVSGEGGLLSGLDLGGAVLDALMPQIQSQAREAFNTSFEEAVMGENTDDSPFSRFADEQTEYNVERTGEVYALTLMHPEEEYDVVFRLEQNQQRKWRIVAIENLEDIVDSILSENSF